MKDGAFVKKGALLAKINDAELQAQLRQQKVQLDLARKNKARFEKMLAVNGINQADYDDAVNQVASLEASIDISLAMIDKTELRAPFDGRMGLRTVSPGAYVTPQTVMGSIVEDGPCRIDFTLPEKLAKGLRPGTQVNISSSDDEPAVATVIATDPLVNTSTRNVKLRAVLKSGGLSAGAYVKVSSKRKVNCIAVPTQCILPDAVASKVIIVKEGKGKFVPVKTGIRTEDLVQITEGVEADDTVIVAGVLFVRPNAAVKVRSVRQLTTVAE
jgi:membrane fusion protein (multidrug efflux system)